MDDFVTFGSEWRDERLLVCLITIQSQHEHISNFDRQSNIRVCEIRHPDDILRFLMELVTLCANIGILFVDRE